jgi:alkanesulfonate monooxygenase SsuD/methylene tetrahydromethanopterin reductase-like flavin-dependent oxidoreductase (luciferase family)
MTEADHPNSDSATRTPGLEFGLVLTAANDLHTPATAQVDEHRTLVKMAADFGFGLMAAGQHFLSPNLRYLQPIPYLAHLAALAPTMRTATGILLLPLLHPVQVAEETATLDVLTSGKAVLGVGMGYTDNEFRVFDIERKTRSRRFTESLEVIRSLWSGDPFRHEGEFWTIDAPGTVVTPVQPGGPPVWIAGQTEAAVRRAARLGEAWYVPPFPTHSELRKLRSMYLEERERFQRPPEKEFPVRRELFIAPTPRAAMERIGAQVQDRFNTYLDWGMRQGSDLTPGFADRTEEALASRFILGPPELCAERINELRKELGMTTFVLKVQWPGLDARESRLQLEQFGEQVLPLLAGTTG